MLVSWTVETLSKTVDKEIDRLPKAHRAKLERIVDLIEESSPSEVAAPYVKPIDGMLEIRVTAEGGISRAIFVTVKRKTATIVRVFVKKTQKTPKREIDLAKERAKTLK